MIGNYIKYPREIIEMKDLDIKRMAVFTYLARCRTLGNTVHMTINHLIEKSGYKPNTHFGKINHQMNIILDTLESIGYFNLSQGKYTTDKFCILNLNTHKFDVVSGYCCISLEELDLMFISKINGNSVTFTNLIAILAYIRVNKFRRSDHQQGSPKKKPEFFYRQIKQMAFDVGLSERATSKCIQTLNDLGIIVSHSMPRYKDKYGNWHTDVTLFVDKLNNWENELKWGEDFLLKNKTLDEQSKQYT